MSDTIYRAMLGPCDFTFEGRPIRDCVAHGWQPHDVWIDEANEIHVSEFCRKISRRSKWEPNPLTDWRAFGEIVGWAERKGWKFSIDHDTQGRYTATVWRIEPHWEVVYEHEDDWHPDFRRAVLAALESAIGGEQ